MKYLNILIIALLVVVGLACYLIQAHINPTTYPEWHTAIGNIGSAVLICGLLTLFQNLITKHMEDANLRHLLGISESIKESNLKTILTDSSKYNYHDIVTRSITFCAILNDGLRWVGNNSPALEKRFSKSNTSTEFFLVDPDGCFCQALAMKTIKNVPDLQSKIMQSVSQLESTYNKTDKRGELKIYFLKNYPTQSLFYSDYSVIVTPYQVSSGRTTIPLFEYVYEEGHKSIASHLFEDLERVRNESKLISVNGVRISDNQSNQLKSEIIKRSGWRRLLFWKNN